MDKKVQHVNEVHVTVPSDHFQLARLFQFVLDGTSGARDKLLDKCLNLRVTSALSLHGEFPEQPMLTYLLHGACEEAIDHAQAVAELMRKSANLNVLRVKVETMAHSGQAARVDGDRYFEFRWKVPILDFKQWRQVDSVCARCGAALFFNPFSKKPSIMQPVVTLRRYDTSLSEAEKALQQLLVDLAVAGFKVKDSTIQHEYSLLDTNVGMDRGWLFAKNPKECTKRE